ncbi:MAG: HAMP domain-containing sensor histidine kinase, partial [Bacteroidota bacterium]
VAHDLKNPISQIKGLVDIIQMENEKMSEQQLKFLGMIGGTSDRLNNMIHRLLDARAVEKAEIKLHLQEVDLADMMEEVRIDFSMRAAEKRIQLVYEQPDFQHLVNVDPDYTRQILDNILSNALKFSPFDKNIYLVLKRKGDQIYAGIQDEGPGITPEDMKKLFGKFQKLSARPTNGESSSGLGLSIVKRFAEEMGGTVWAESDPGQGATFWVRFPAVEVLA